MRSVASAADFCRYILSTCSSSTFCSSSVWLDDRSFFSAWHRASALAVASARCFASLYPSSAALRRDWMASKRAPLPVRASTSARQAVSSFCSFSSLSWYASSSRLSASS